MLCFWLLDMTRLLKASNSRVFLSLVIVVAASLCLLTCLALADIMWTHCMNIVVIVFLLRSVNVSPQVKIPIVCAGDICALSLLEKVKLSHATIIYESHLDRHGVFWNATYPWSPLSLPHPWISLPFSPHPPPAHNSHPPTPRLPTLLLHWGAMLKAGSRGGVVDSWF